MSGLEIKDITVTYKNGHTAIVDTSFNLPTGSITALVGVNGSGKSTLFKLIAGEIVPDAGAVAIHKGIQVRLMEQDPELSKFNTLGDFALSSLGSNETYKIEE